MMMIFVVVVALCIIAAARLLPRMCLANGASRPSFGTAHFVAVLVATALAAVASQVAGGLVAEALIALLVPYNAQTVFTSRDAGEDLAFEGAFLVFALLVAPLAAIAIARAFTLRRDVMVRIVVAALAGEAALTCGIFQVMRPLLSTLMTTTAASDSAVAPHFDVVSVAADAVSSLVVFAVVGVIAGVAFTVVAIGPALRARDASERRALLVAACVAAPAALVLGGLATPSPDIISQIFAAMMIGVAWLAAVGLGVGARGLRGLPRRRGN